MQATNSRYTGTPMGPSGQPALPEAGGTKTQAETTATIPQAQPVPTTPAEFPSPPFGALAPPPSTQVQATLQGFEDSTRRLLAAVLEGKLAEVKAVLLEQPLLLNASLQGQATASHIAARNGQTDIMEFLLTQHKIELDTVDEEGQTPLHTAARHGHHAVLAQMLANPMVDSNTLDDGGWAPLHSAIQAGHVDAVRALLNAPQTDPALLGPHDLNILHMLGLAPNAEALLDVIRSTLKPPELFEELVNMPDQWDALPVSFAAQRSKGKVVIDALRPAVIATASPPLEPTTYERGWLIAGQEIPLEHGHNLIGLGTKAGIKMKSYGSGRDGLKWEDLKDRSIRDGDFVIFIAHAYWDETLQRVMLELGDGEVAPLVDVALLLYTMGAKKLMFIGCEVSMAATALVERFNNDPTIPRPTDQDGGYEGLDITFVGREKRVLMTLGLEAAKLFVDDCITAHETDTPGTALLTRSVQPLNTVRWNSTQRKLAGERRAELTLAQIDPTWSPDQVLALKRSLMFMHVSDNDLDDVEALLKSDASLVHARTHMDENALHVASDSGHKAMVEKLLQNGAIVHLVERDGKSPLHIACLEGHTAVVQVLLDAGARVNQATFPNASCLTPLHCACSKGFPGVVSLLLAAGANPGEEDIDGETPLDYARSRKHDAVVAVLEAHAKTQRSV